MNAARKLQKPPESQRDQRRSSGLPLFEVGRNCWRIERADRASFLVDGEATLKRVRFYDDRIELIPANPNYKPLVVHKALSASVEIVGPLAFVYRTIA
jgi:hypothetical protein